MKIMSSKLSFYVSALLFLALIMGLVMPLQIAQAVAPATIVYDAIPNPLPPNMPSQPFQAGQTFEFGDYIHLAGTDRLLNTVTVTMSDWALFSDYSSDIRYSSDNVNWTHPITLNIYNVIAGSPNTVGSLLATVTQTVKIPWRPAEDSINCPIKSAPGYAYKWQSTPGAPNTNCYNALATNITFDMSSLNVTLPDDIIVGIAYNTETYGAAPIGVGGPYNSLNVGAVGSATFGTDDNTDKVFFNSLTPGQYGDAGAGGVGIFREDINWTPYGTVPIQITAAPVPPDCAGTLDCYVDAINGNDVNGGASIADAKKTIQAGVDAVGAGGTVHVLPGDYNETALNRSVLSVNGPHQFGLFVSQDKDGISIIGVNSSDIPVTDYNSLLSHVETNATNNFGTSGIFVEGDNVTIAGLDILDNSTGNNKTIEIIGDNFKLEHSHINVSDGGSVYFNDWQFDTGSNTSHIQSYTLNHNWIDLSASIDLTSGAGFSGAVSGRKITNNKFVADGYWPSISFSGSDTGVPWFVQSVGGAVITGNDFTNTSNTADNTSAHIRARGTYDNSQFDWKSYWQNNTFNKATVTLIGALPAFDVRTYSYPNSYGTFNNVRRIGVTIQGEVNYAVASDTVLVKAGTYAENVSIPKAITLKGAQYDVNVSGRTAASVSESTIQGLVTVNASDVNINGFTLTNPGQTYAMSITPSSSNIAITYNNVDTVGAVGLAQNVHAIVFQNGADSVTIAHNRFNNIKASTKSVSAIGVLDTTSTNSSTGLLIQGNIFTDIASGSKGAYGVILNNKAGVPGAQIKDNVFSGLNGGWTHAIGLEGPTPNAIVTGNIFSSLTALSPDNAAILFEKNSVGNTVTVANNQFNGAAYYGVAVHPNDLPGGLNGYNYTVNAESNWWNTASGPGIVGPGAGTLVGPNVDFTPWLCFGTDTSPDIGFQPLLVTDCTAPVISYVLTPASPDGTNGWYKGNVTLAWSVTDPESLVSKTGCYDQTITADQFATDYSCSATSAGGSAGPVTVSIKRDATPPTLAPTVSPNPVFLNGVATATPNASDSFSGVASSSCDPVVTSSVGIHSVNCTATDNAGNTNTVSVSYNVTYKFTGFFQPVDMNAVNIAKAGQAIPVKWRLTDANGVPVSDPASFMGLSSYNVGCNTLDSELPDVIETYSGSSGLQYLSDGYWQFNWKTPKTYAGQCRTMYVQFQGGFKSPEVDFKFKP